MDDVQLQQQQQLHQQQRLVEQQQQQNALSFNKILKNMSKEMQEASVRNNYGAIEGKNFIEPNTTTEGVQHLKARKRKAVDEVHMQAMKIIDSLIKIDKLIKKTQEISYEHTVLSNKLKGQNKIESKIVEERKKKQITIQELRTMNIPRPQVVLPDVEEDYFGEGPDLR